MTGGLEWNYAAYCDFDLFGKFGGSVVCGTDEQSFSRVWNDLSVDALQVYSGNGDDAECASLGMELSIGISKDTCYCNCPGRIALSYDVTHWTDITNFAGS